MVSALSLTMQVTALQKSINLKCELLSDSFREEDNGIPQAANKFLHACQKCIMYENNKTELAHTNVKFAGTKTPPFFSLVKCQLPQVRKSFAWIYQLLLKEALQHLLRKVQNVLGIKRH